MIDKKLKRSIFISSIILFLLSILLHFIYDLSNKFFLFGLIAPVNESVFEHLKLTVYPIIFWWVIFYKLKKKTYFIDISRWLFGLLTSVIISIITILSIYYFLRYGVGKELAVLNIISTYVALLLGQFAGYHIYKFSSGKYVTGAVIMFLFIVTFFTILTINPPKLPIFEDNNNHTYGINNKTKNERKH